MSELDGLDAAPSIFARVKLHDRSITLYDWMLPAVSEGRNLICTDRDGKVLWRAKPPRTGRQNDCFTNVWKDGGQVKVFSWSCFEALLDPSTGTLSDLIFTK